MTDVQERTTFKFVSLISIEELSMRLLDSTRVFDTSSVRCFVLQSPMRTTLEEECVKVSLDLPVVHLVRHLRDVCHAETQQPC